MFSINSKKIANGCSVSQYTTVQHSDGFLRQFRKRPVIDAHSDSVGTRVNVQVGPEDLSEPAAEDTTLQSCTGAGQVTGQGTRQQGQGRGTSTGWENRKYIQFTKK